jgi:exopolyphosphatase/pppGpp-phosphohydrolase
MPIGGMLLTSAYLASDPPRPEELSAALSVVELHLDDARREAPELVAALGSATVLGLGAIATVAAIEVGLSADLMNGDGDGDGPLHAFELSRVAVEDVFRTIATESRQDRAHNPGLPLTRVDAIVGACVVLVETMRQLALDRVVVSQRGLLDGLARELIGDRS